MTVYVHLVEGDSAAARLALIARLEAESRPECAVFAQTSEPPTSPLDWLLGPGCVCCLPRTHPRLRLLAATQGRTASRRILIDAGPQALAERIARAIRALPVPVRLARMTA
jgi:hypothetical protein